MELNTLQQLYVDELKDLYNAEQQILKALPQMIKASSNRDLERAFSNHERVTRRQVKRLDRIFRDLGESPKGKKCVGMEGILDEGKDFIKEKPDPDVLNAGLISKAQHVEHYEMAGYGTVRTYAQQLGLDEHARLLQETLEEEREADRTLTSLAERSINIEAVRHADRAEEGEERGTRRRTASTAGRGTRGLTTTARATAGRVSRGAVGGSSRRGTQPVS